MQLSGASADAHTSVIIVLKSRRREGGDSKPTKAKRLPPIWHRRSSIRCGDRTVLHVPRSQLCSLHESPLAACAWRLGLGDETWEYRSVCLSEHLDQAARTPRPQNPPQDESQRRLPICTKISTARSSGAGLRIQCHATVEEVFLSSQPMINSETLTGEP